MSKIDEIIDLLPCPFCGNTVIHRGYNALKKMQGLGMFYRECCKCLVSLDGYATSIEADIAWNTRTESPELAQTREALAAAEAHADLTQQIDDLAVSLNVRQKQSDEDGYTIFRLRSERDAYRAKCEAYEAMLVSAKRIDFQNCSQVSYSTTNGVWRWWADRDVRASDGFITNDGKGFDTAIEAFAALDTKQEVEDGKR